MANKKIKSSDIVEPKLLSGVISEAKELLKAIEGIQGALKANIKVQKEFLAVSKVKDFNGYKQNEEAIKAVKTETQLLVKAENERKTIENQLIVLQKQEAVELAKNKLLLQQRSKAIQEQAKAELGLVGAYDKTSKRLNDLRKSYQNLSIAGRENGKVAKGLKQEIDKLDTALKKADASTGKFNRNVGNYGSVLSDAVNSSSVFGGKLNGLTSMFESLGSKGAMVAGVIGVAVTGALTALNLVLTKTEAGMDFVARETERFNTILGVLANKILNLDFKNLLNELQGAGQAGADYADELDRMSDSEIRNSKALTILNSKIAKNKLAMEDANLTTQEKIKLAKEAIKLDVQRTGVDLVGGKTTYSLDEKTLMGQARAQYRAYKFLTDKIKLTGVELTEEQRKKLADLYNAQVEVSTEAFIGRKKLAAQVETFERELIKKRDEKIQKEKEQLKERSDLFEKELEDAEKKASDLIENPTFTNFTPGDGADQIFNDSIEKQRLEAEAYLDKLAKEKEAEEKQAKFIQDLQKTITESAIRELEKQADAKIEALDKDIELRKDNISRQEELAARGLDNTAAYEKKKLAEAELAKEIAQKQKLKDQKLYAYFSLIAAYANSGDKSAAANALADILTAETVSLLAWEGAENVGEALGNKGKKHNGRDGYRGVTKSGDVIGFDGNERILSKDQNKLIGDISNDALASLAYNTRMNAEKTDGAKDHTGYALLIEMKKLNETIAKKKEISVNWNSHDERVETLVSNGMKKTVRHVRKPPRI